MEVTSKKKNSVSYRCSLTVIEAIWYQKLRNFKIIIFFDIKSPPSSSLQMFWEPSLVDKTSLGQLVVSLEESDKTDRLKDGRCHMSTVTKMKYVWMKHSLFDLWRFQLLSIIGWYLPCHWLQRGRSQLILLSFFNNNYWSKTIPESLKC